MTVQITPSQFPRVSELFERISARKQLLSRLNGIENSTVDLAVEDKIIRLLLNTFPRNAAVVNECKEQVSLDIEDLRSELSTYGIELV